MPKSHRRNSTLVDPILIFVLAMDPSPSPHPFAEVGEASSLSGPQHGSPASYAACIFNLLKDIIILTMIFTWSLSLVVDLLNENEKVASSLDLSIAKELGAAIAVIPLHAQPPSPYDQYCKHNYLILNDL